MVTPSGIHSKNSNKEKYSKIQGSKEEGFGRIRVQSMKSKGGNPWKNNMDE